MKIEIENTFWIRFLSQLDYIASYSPSAARKFRKGVLDAIPQICKNPYQYRKSIHFDDILVRDLVYKGYTITFRITKTQIKVFGFTRYQQNVTD
ncbi:MAG: type II toxin-antitoxin system RelE/ParE family toxin [Bacteroidia bacterium]|nr:type II toxin-antitoxin system RelE/ParE family toxin [Bacteroidia bacterium]